MHPGPAARDTFDTGFDSRDNSFNLIRLLLACAVLVGHGSAVGGFGEINVGNYPVASLAVDAFFAISGFLITRSFVRGRSAGRYLWHRFLRIFPGFWTCLIVTAAVFGTLGWLHLHHSLAGYVGSAHGPVQYVLENATLKIRFYDIAGTPVVPSAPRDAAAIVWNGSLWTLLWEFLCYLGIAVLGVTGLLRRRAVVPAIAVGIWLVLVVHLVRPQVGGVLLDTQQAAGVTRLGLIFLAGATMYLFADRIPLTWGLAAASAVLVGVGVFLSEPQAITALPLAYLCIWLAIRIPAPVRGIGARNDLSYGIYVYGSPVQQLLAMYSLQRFGVVAWFVLTGAATVTLAAASWALVERCALGLKDWSPGFIRGPGRARHQARSRRLSA